ncbi:MAG TPA: hypothetical protein VFJ14_17775 [Nocardioidaceae bacterium]|nr:hypothetical protein [Nocardioidaceae bacterium]
MTITANGLTRAAGISAAAAGLIFIGVQINHPHLDTASITTSEVVIRNSLKVLMAVLALAGITGMYLSQVRRNGLLGLVGYLLLGTGYLLIMSSVFLAAYVLPSIARTDPAFVQDVIAATTGGTPTGDLGALGIALRAQDLTYLAGGLVFGIALYRAGVLARWAAVLLAVGGVVTVVLSVMPDAFYRLLAFPNGIAMIALGYSLWSTARTNLATRPAAIPGPRVTTAGAE